ncbi:MAG TPA: glycine dehydrogenase (aminomethyl-transferring), partial [Flavobacteriales bacterium]|nr:glycine dehydrogenase (aminomethyl-transferring) [Flavobacteriales bacterium]
MKTDRFSDRHIGPSSSETEKMLRKIGVGSLNELIEQTVPNAIRRKSELNVGAALTEFDYLNHLRKVGAKNKVLRSYIGMGYYGTILPSVIQRNILENPGWYTAYTPYQAEIAQGRLEAILNFQTMVIDLTGMPIANASLLDEGTAAAEAMAMLFSDRDRDTVKRGANVFFVSDEVYPQTIDILRTRAIPLGIELQIGNFRELKFTDKIFGSVLQYPALNGEVYDYADFVKQAKANKTAV